MRLYFSARRAIAGIVLLLLVCCSSGWFVTSRRVPTLYLIGDSTVKNGSGRGEGGLWGWGDFLYEHLDTTRRVIRNHARGGRSSRTFLTEGLWDEVLRQLGPGDYVLIQFGHNDGGAINDTLRARGSLRGVGEEVAEIDNLLTHRHEVVHTYGWYMRRYIRDAKAKGAIPVVCSPVPRNVWEQGAIPRTVDGYAGWAAAVAREEGAFFIDLHDRVAKKYEALGEDVVTSTLFLQDHTHTNREGARINAATVAEGLNALKGVSLRQNIK